LSLEQVLTAALSLREGLATVGDITALAGAAGAPFSADQAEILAALATTSQKIESIRAAQAKLPDRKTIEIAARLIGKDKVDDLTKQMQFLIDNARQQIVIDVVYRTTGTPPSGPSLVLPSSPTGTTTTTATGETTQAVVVNVNVSKVGTIEDINALAWRVAAEIQRRRN
jgi:hypothetical protein